MNLDEAASTIDNFYGPPLSVISDTLRGFLCAKPGCQLIGCDFSAIEARVIAWLAGEEKVLEIFRDHGMIYEHAAAGIYNVDIEDVSKDQRQIGKVAVLALGYQGGKGAFKSMASVYGLEIEDHEAEAIKDAWRESNYNIVRFWYDCESAAINAVRNPGVKFTAGASKREVTFLMNGSFLWCRLPSGRVNCYPYPKIQHFDTPWGNEKEGLTYMGVNSYTNKWERIKTYGGKLAENVTQAVARDILAEAMFSLEGVGYSIVMTVHDEIVCEVPKDFGSLTEVEKIMSISPDWANDLPLDAKGWIGDRFRK